jgi:hypothetical protein
VILRGRDLSKFELRVAGYQFQSDRFDANWLVVAGRVAPPDGRAWKFRDPALLTWEVQGLSSWLEAWHRNRPSRSAKISWSPTCASRSPRGMKTP